MNTINQLKNNLDEILASLEDDLQETNNQALGAEALAIIKQILEINPFDIYALISRMRLNTDWVFDNSSAIISDAEFIIENDAFKKDKMVGYDWLTWVYRDVLAMPDKAVETIENQLIDVHSLYDKKYEKDLMEGRLVSNLGFIKFHADEKEMALQLWDKSCKKDPYVHERNAIAGMLSLELKDWKRAHKFLRNHFDWCFESEDGYRLQYGLKLKELYDNKELDNEPGLLALLFHVIRNERYDFKLHENLNFLNQYLPEAEKWAAKFPENSMLWTAIANTYFFDSKNYELALHGYTKAMEGDSPSYAPLDRILKSAKKSKVDLLTLPFKIEGSAIALYNHMTEMPDGKKKNQKKFFSELKCKYGELCYTKYKAYFVEGKGDVRDNQQHVFAMACNNYGIALTHYNKLFFKKKDRPKMYEYAANIHIQGYELSPFLENLDNGAIAFYEAKNYTKCIEYYKLYLKEYSGDISLFDIQNAYWYITYSYSKMKQHEKVTETYIKAKELYIKTGSGVRNATNKFIYIAKENLYIEVYITKAYEKVIPELQWFLEQKSFEKINSKEVGLMYHYLGDCFRETNQTEKAIAAYQNCVSLLEEEKEGFYLEISQESYDYIKELGGSPKVKKRKSLLKRLFDF